MGKPTPLPPEGWYRFVGAAGTKMPTTRAPAYRCVTDWSGWLDGSHPTVEDDGVPRMVCFSGLPTGCNGLLQDAVNEVFGAILQIDIEINQS